MSDSIKLPRVYMNEGGNYPQHLNKAKISYSQLGSFKEYKMGYLRDYILGLGTGESGMFAAFGSAVGGYFEDGSDDELLTDFDKEVVDKIQKYDSSTFESEIVIDLEPFGLPNAVLQGFSDHEYDMNAKRYIEDLKTGNQTSMMEKYGDMDKYYQTRIYAYQRENEGHTIGGCNVRHLARKGNNTTKGDKNVLRLSGDIDFIPTPYIREDVEKYLRETVVPVCKEIAEYLKIYQKLFAQK